MAFVPSAQTDPIAPSAIMEAASDAFAPSADAVRTDAVGTDALSVGTASSSPSSGSGVPIALYVVGGAALVAIVFLIVKS